MDLSLTTADIEAQARARAFAETWLHPHEIACDERTLSKKTLAEIKKNVLRYKLNGVNHTKADGGHGYSPRFTFRPMTVVCTVPSSAMKRATYTRP